MSDEKEFLSNAFAPIDDPKEQTLLLNIRKSNMLQNDPEQTTESIQEFEESTNKMAVELKNLVPSIRDEISKIQNEYLKKKWEKLLKEYASAQISYNQKSKEAFNIEI